VKKEIVLGDMNSAPVDTIPSPPYPTVLPWAPALPVLPPYAVFASNGFTDAWTMRAHADAGFSCCQSEDLANRDSQLSERIDMVFSIPRPSRVEDVRLLGNRPSDKIRSPGGVRLWPADHAALAARLQFD
jgi:hypothetical protein